MLVAATGCARVRSSARARPAGVTAASVVFAGTINGAGAIEIETTRRSSDTTLVVNGPDGRWYCDDDGGNGSLNPALQVVEEGEWENIEFREPKKIAPTQALPRTMQ